MDTPVIPPPPDRPAPDPRPMQVQQPFRVAGKPNPNKYDPHHMYYPKPAGHDERELCGAPIKNRAKEIIGWCGAKVGECRHCGAWCVSGGYACPTIGGLGRRCRMHGDGVPVGPASPSFRHGRYSQVMPKTMKSDYHKSLRDPAMLEMREEIAIMQARVITLFKRLGTHESGGLLLRIREVWLEFVAANEANPPDKARIDAAGNELNRVIMAGASDEECWGEIYRVIGNKGVITRLEWQRMKDLHEMVLVDQVMTMVAAFVDAVHRWVKDPEAKRGLSQEIAAITGRR